MNRKEADILAAYENLDAALCATGNGWEKLRPHIYIPDQQAMGDCRVCSHGRDKPWHVLAPATGAK